VETGEEVLENQNFDWLRAENLKIFQNEIIIKKYITTN
jgi:hypothetical protein